MFTERGHRRRGGRGEEISRQIGREPPPDLESLVHRRADRVHAKEPHAAPARERERKIERARAERAERREGVC